MKCVGIVDCSGNGEQSLMVELSKELEHRGYKVALINCLTGLNGFAENETTIENYALDVVNCLPDKTVFSFKSKKSLDKILAFLDVDYVLIEGFTEDKSYPRIVCVNERSQDEVCLEGIEIAGYGKAQNYPFPVTRNIKELVSIIEEKSFKLPNLDCAACGFDSCYDFAQEIVKENKKIDDCVSLNPKVEISIDENPLPMNPFISRIVENVVRALLSSFKGYKKGSVKISIS